MLTACVLQYIFLRSRAVVLALLQRILVCEVGKSYPCGLAIFRGCTISSKRSAVR